MKMFLDEVREKKPARGLAADHENSRAEAIHLKCEECMQERSCADCPAHGCPLWPYRLGADDRQRNPGAVPTREQYAAWGAQRGGNGGGTADALREWRERQRSEGES